MILALKGLLSLIFFLLGALHFYWAFGGEWGLNVALPTREPSAPVIRPNSLLTVLVGLVLVSFSLFYLPAILEATLLLPEWVVPYLGWGIPSLFALRTVGDFKYVGLFKKVKTTPFAKADTKYFVPLCALLALAGFLVQTYTSYET